MGDYVRAGMINGAPAWQRGKYMIYRLGDGCWTVAKEKDMKKSWAVVGSRKAADLPTGSELLREWYFIKDGEDIDDELISCTPVSAP